MCKKVYVIGGERAYVNMYKLRGYTIVDQIGDADLVQFTGGEDVSPNLYGETKHPTTHCSKVRDDYEKQVFDFCVENGIGMAGICRGAQFLNVMNGGKMLQDVDGHALYEGHLAVDLIKGDVVHVTSTHHQMMRAGVNGVVVMACPTLCEFKEHMDSSGFIEDVCESERIDTEAVWYGGNKCLCFQPHPEIGSATHDCVNKFFELVERYL